MKRRDILKTEIFENLRKVILRYDPEGAVYWTKKAVEERVDPIKVADTLTKAVRQIGEGYGRGEFFLPDLVGAANTMQSAMPIIQEEIKRRGSKQKTLGTVVIGTVHGDIHSIGKTMVSTLLTAGGFNVYDLGVNVTAEKFLEAIKKYKADILAMSALLTTTILEQKKVIDTLKKESLKGKVKVMVGGAAITEESAGNIDADGYGATAPDAVELAKRMIG